MSCGRQQEKYANCSSQKSVGTSLPQMAMHQNKSEMLYRQCLHDINPLITDFINSAKEISKHQQLKNDYIMLGACQRMHKKIEKMQAIINGQFDAFDETSKEMWVDMSPVKFAKFRDTIESSHTTIGALLCSMAVKMDHWSKQFPNPEYGGPIQRADFIINDMAQGW